MIAARMHAKLTQVIAHRSEPTSRDYDIADTLIPGFELRVRHSGTKVWTYRYRTPEGHQRRYVVGRFPGLGAAGARRLALTVASEVANGTDVQARKRAVRVEGDRARRSTLRHFLDDQYEPWAKTHLKTAAFQISRVKADFAAWMDKPMSDLNSWLIEGWRKRQREANKQSVTINRNLQRLQGLLSRAVEWKILERHPFAGLKPLKTDCTGRVRYLSPDEETRMREALVQREESLRQARIRFNAWLTARNRPMLPLRTGEYVDHLRPIVLLALNTGLRRSELFHLCWEDLDLTAKWVCVDGETAKNGQTRRVPLNTEAIAILQAWRKQASDTETRVFPGVGGKRLKRVDRAWRGLRKRAGLREFRFHDLRHHFASRLVQSGIDLNTVRELLGHAHITMVLRYAHLSPDRLAAAVEKVVR